MYDRKSNLNNFSPTLKKCLSGAVKLTKNSDTEKYKYAGYGTEFDSKETFSYPSGGTDVNVVIFGAGMSSSVHANNRAKSTLILGNVFAQGLENTTLYAEKNYSVNFTATKKILFKFAL